MTKGWSPDYRISLLTDWRFWGRPAQIAPEGDWSIWSVRAGRGWGKTLTGSSWINERAMERPRWIAIVARTPAEARDVAIEGPGGLVKRRTPAPDLPPGWQGTYEPSKRRITWPNGSWATIYSDEEPDQLRGFSGDTAWLDEFGKFKHAEECWDNLMFGMREMSNDHPRTIITTTPRPIKILQQIEKLPGAVVTIGSSYENRKNLDKQWFERVIEHYEGTRLGRQEIYAEYLNDVLGALWSHVDIDKARIKESELPKLVRIVVAIDPPTSNNKNSSLAGICVAGIDKDRNGYVLADLSGQMTPAEWAATAVSAYEHYKADRIVAEANQGGDMVRHTIQTEKPSAAITLVHASKGKQARAEPIAALYEQGKVHHVGLLPDLEDQMTTWEPLTGMPSPDRLDAMVWALTDLILNDSGTMSWNEPTWMSTPRGVPGWGNGSMINARNPATVSGFEKPSRFPT